MTKSKLEELRDRTLGLTLRRLKENVLDLPDKIITPVYLRLKSKQYEEVMGEYYDWYDKNPEESKSLTVQFSKLTKVRQIIADEKIAQTIELAENILEQDKKVIIFCNFTDSLNKITEHFGKAAVKLDGSMSKPERQHSVDEFQDNPKVKVFVESPYIVCHQPISVQSRHQESPTSLQPLVDCRGMIKYTPIGFLLGRNSC